ncbi:MAG: hypothetical protein QXO27_03815 [Candidatus Aenigmatarchaeota archaeon]
MKKLLSLIVILSFFLMIQTVGAISMGSVIKKDTISIKANESTKFTILFWNVEENSYKVNLEVKDAPKDWFVNIQPKEFILNSSTGKEYISLPYMDNIIKALPVEVFVKPENAHTDKYFIIIKARAGIPGKDISFFQEREFKLTVEIIDLQSQKETKSNISEITKESRHLTGGFLAQVNINYIFYIISFVSILVISLLIYKYA